MERKLTKLEHSHVQVDVTVDEASWKEAQDEAFKKLAQNVTIDGFRKGKAPLNLVKSKIDQVKVLDEAINSLLPKIYKEILEEDKIKPFARPTVDVTEIKEDSLKVRFTIVTEPEVELGKYKGLSLGKEETSVTSEDVDNALKALLSNNATLELKDGEVKEGDTVVIDYLGKVDGEAFEGGSATNYELEIGSHSFIPGFEDQIVGHKAGDKFDINVTFPHEYVDALKDKEAVFSIELHEVKEKKLPELNDEFVKGLKIPEVETVEQLKKYKEDEIKHGKENAARSEYLKKLYVAITESSKIDIPEEIIDNQFKAAKQDMVSRMSQSGLTLEQYLSYVGQKEEQFDATLRENATKDVTTYLIINKVGELENIVVTDEELEFELAKLADQYSMTIDKVKEALHEQLEDFRNNIRMGRIEEFLFKENN